MGGTQSAGAWPDPSATVARMNPDGTSYVDHELHPFLPERVYQSGGAV